MCSAEICDFFALIVASSQTENALPLTFIAVAQQDRLLGMVGLWGYDLISRQDLCPWLAALYIDESQRGKGLGGQVSSYVIRYAQAPGFDRLYLSSACLNYDTRFGWQYIGESLDYPATSVHLYRRELSLPTIQGLG